MKALVLTPYGYLTEVLIRKGHILDDLEDCTSGPMARFMPISSTTGDFVKENFVIGRHISIYLNEDGICENVQNLSLNPVMTKICQSQGFDDKICGNVVFCGIDGNGRISSLSETEIAIVRGIVIRHSA